MFTGILYQNILRDDKLFETKMKALLENVEYQAILPELIETVMFYSFLSICL
jgi:hypothetical protein